MTQTNDWPQPTKHRVMMARNNPHLPYLWPCDVARVLGLSTTFVRQKVRPCERHGDRMRWSWEQVESYRASVTLAPAENTAGS